MYCSFSVTLLQLSKSHSSDYEERKTFEKTEMKWTEVLKSLWFLLTMALWTTCSHHKDYIGGKTPNRQRLPKSGWGHHFVNIYKIKCIAKICNSSKSVM